MYSMYQKEIDIMINEKTQQRELAYVETISWIKPIEGADNIELAGVLGWNLIVKKGEFKVGDKCVYFEIDSKLPEKEWSEFLANKHYKVKTYQLKKFGVISQGLALPLDLIGLNPDEYEVGDFLTEQLGVKYTTEEDNTRKAKQVSHYKSLAQSISAKHTDFIKKHKFVRYLLKRTWGIKLLAIIWKVKPREKDFPTQFLFIHKTDEERCENIPFVVNYENPLIATEKLDGTSSTYILERKNFNKFEFYVCSRNVRMINEDQECYHDTNIYWENAIKYKIEEHLKNYLLDNPKLDYVCIQGESVGNVQGNPLKLQENDLYIFNFYQK